MKTSMMKHTTVLLAAMIVVALATGHRVVAAGGKLGGFGGGLPLKRKLLDLEAANSPAIR